MTAWNNACTNSPPKQSYKKKKRKKYLSFLRKEVFSVFLAFCGWFLHYIPFFFVGRVLYFHHYYPALFFASFSLCYILKNVRFKLLVFFISIFVFSFFLYSKVTYGFSTATALQRISLVPSWDFIEKKQ